MAALQEKQPKLLKQKMSTWYRLKHQDFRAKHTFIPYNHKISHFQMFYNPIQNPYSLRASSFKFLKWQSKYFGPLPSNHFMRHWHVKYVPPSRHVSTEACHTAHAGNIGMSTSTPSHPLWNYYGELLTHTSCAQRLAIIDNSVVQIVIVSEALF